MSAKAVIFDIVSRCFEEKCDVEKNTISQ